MHTNNYQDVLQAILARTVAMEDCLRKLVTIFTGSNPDRLRAALRLITEEKGDDDEEEEEDAAAHVDEEAPTQIIPPTQPASSSARKSQPPKPNKPPKAAAAAASSSSSSSSSSRPAPAGSPVASHTRHRSIIQEIEELDSDNGDETQSDQGVVDMELDSDDEHTASAAPSKRGSTKRKKSN